LWLQAGDLLIERSNSPELVGTARLYRGPEKYAIFPDLLIRVRVHSLCMPAFVEYVLQCDDTRRYFIERAQGTSGSMPKIDQEVVAGLQILLPPLAEQQRIVEVVDGLLVRVNAARDCLMKIPSILKRFRQSLLAAACSGRLTEDWREEHPTIVRDKPPSSIPRGSFEHALPDLPDIPDTWAMASVRDVAVQIQYGLNTKADAEPGRGVPMLRMGNIQDGRVDLRELKHVQRSKKLCEFRVGRNDLLFNRTNSPELVGKAAVFHGDEEMVFASYLVRVCVVPTAAVSEYVCAWINSPWGRQWARVVRTDGVSQSNINATKMAEMPLPLAPLEEQREIVRRLAAFMNVADAIERRVAVATARTDKVAQAILSKAFRGELVPTEAEVARQEGREYESASLLLERIRAEHSARSGQEGTTGSIAASPRARRNRRAYRSGKQA
jgi:type I restriction enzyme, S subunit